MNLCEEKASPDPRKRFFTGKNQERIFRTLELHGSICLDEIFKIYGSRSQSQAIIDALEYYLVARYNQYQQRFFFISQRDFLMLIGNNSGEGKNVVPVPDTDI